MQNVTGAEVKEAMIAANILTVPHHDCAGCGVWVKYFREGQNLFFDSSCGCSGSFPTHRPWQDAADWINMQTLVKHRNRIRVAFGLPVEEELEEGLKSAELQGTFACPTCGVGVPHSHSEAEQAAYHDDQIRGDDGWTSTAKCRPKKSGWYLCLGVTVLRPV